MGQNLGKWSEAEKNLLIAGASNELAQLRTGRTVFSISTARSKLGKLIGKQIKPVPDSRFLAEERRKIREIRKIKTEAKKHNQEIIHEIMAKKVISIDELRKTREKDWVPTASGAGVMCVPKKKILLRDNIVKYRSNPLDPVPVDPKTIHEETGMSPVTEKSVWAADRFTQEEKKEWNDHMEQMDKNIASHITVTEPVPSKDELFFEINGTRVTVAAGTKKVDVMNYGLIIEF